MPDTLTFTSVHNIPGAHASAAFTSKTSEVFKEEHNIAPIIINDKMKYIPWGGDNQMPYNTILGLRRYPVKSAKLHVYF